jgi:chorismate mutase / prephenate dehydratase
MRLRRWADVIRGGMNMERRTLWDRLWQIDSNIVELLNQRAEVAAMFRHATEADEAEGSARRSTEEALRRAVQGSRGVLPKETLAGIYSNLLTAFEPIARTVPVAVCLGPAGSFSHLAAGKYFGPHCTYAFADDERDVLERTIARDADYGVLSIGNSYSGLTGETIDLLTEHVGDPWGSKLEDGVWICGEVCVKVGLALVGRGQPEQLREVCAHIQSFSLCRTRLDRFQKQYDLPDLKYVLERSTADAARRAALDTIGSVGAIANRLLAEVWHLRVFQNQMEDDPTTRTRFVVLGRDRPPPTGKDRTMVWFPLVNKPGALVGTLEEFCKHGVNMIQVASRPGRDEPSVHSCFAEIEGHVSDECVRKALDRMQAKALSNEITVLGSYPRNTEADAVLAHG